MVLDFDGEVKQQTLLPEGLKQAQELQSMGFRHAQQSPPLWKTIAFGRASGLRAAGRVTAAGDVGDC